MLQPSKSIQFLQYIIHTNTEEVRTVCALAYLNILTVHSCTTNALNVTKIISFLKRKLENYIEIQKQVY